MYHLLRPLLFQLDAELAHTLALKALQWLPSSLIRRPAALPVKALGLSFTHPLGLAAGLDKNGEYLDALAKLGFSFIELGTVTPRPQEGNPKPRLFRLPQAGAIINRMGFNNQGVDVLVDNVRRSSYKGILGINIGKNKDTPLTEAANDYLSCLRKVYQWASYVTINISSPNTPDLRQLQQGDFFVDLITQLTEAQKQLADTHQRWVPLVVKLSPDESDDVLKQMAEIILKKGVAGIIATNTTCSRENLTGLRHAQESGGLSGRPLASRSTACLAVLKAEVGDAVTLIGVGGIDNGVVAQEKIKAGADLLQVYTGLIYQGPGLVSSIIDQMHINS